MSLWFFAYGSLLWKPEFEAEQEVRVRLHGFRRRFCLSSVHYRGTVEKPGLVLGLEPCAGAFCDGLALKVFERDETKALSAVRERELVSYAYLEQTVKVEAREGLRTVHPDIEALTYVVDLNHEQYIQTSLENQAQTIACASGRFGTNSEYLFNTFERFQKNDIEDDDMRWLSQRVRELQN